MTAPVPLAERVRPRTRADLVGMETLLGEGVLAAVLSGDLPPNLLLWGPPGSGKTTLARVIADELQIPFVQRSATDSGVKQIREIVAASGEPRVASRGSRTSTAQLFAESPSSRSTLLFLDEIHHFNKTQQDVLLKDVEEGRLFLIGATTENPSFSLNSALLSRLTTVVLPAADELQLKCALERALAHPQGLAGRVTLDDAVWDRLIGASGGDLRVALSMLEQVSGVAASESRERVTAQDVATALRRNPVQYDRKGDNHYDAISAFIKSMRGSDPDAALYWLAYMYEAGEDPLFLARRMIIFASEDVGNSDPQALTVAINAHAAYERVGKAEGWIPLAQAATYLATAPKSNASYAGYKAAAEQIRQHGTRPDVPWHLRNKPTRLLRELAESQGGLPYEYPHDHEYGYVPRAQYLPEEVLRRKRESWYKPSDRGHEKVIGERLRFFRKLDKGQRGDGDG